MKAWIITLGALALNACAPTTSSETAPPSADGRCKAPEYQRFVGRHRNELPQTPRNETWRVTCSSCPMTMDYNPTRVNFVYDDRTQIIREVKCG